MKSKFLICALLTLLIFQLIQFSKAYHNPIPFINGSGFNIEITDSLAFQSDNILMVEVLSGLLNGSSTSLTVWNDRGTLSFIASNDSTLKVSSPDAVEGFEIAISGVNNQTQSERFAWNIGIIAGNNPTISWSWRIESWIDKYTMIALGFTGIGLMVGSPTWVALMIRKKGLDPDSFERIMYGMLIFCVGFGLMVMWLWA